MLQAMFGSICAQINRTRISNLDVCLILQWKWLEKSHSRSLWEGKRKGEHSEVILFPECSMPLCQQILPTTIQYPLKWGGLAIFTWVVQPELRIDVQSSEPKVGPQPPWNSSHLLTKGGMWTLKWKTNPKWKQREPLARKVMVDQEWPHRHLPHSRHCTSENEQRGLSPSDSKEFNDITAWELQHKTERATNETYNIKPPSCHFYSNSKTLYWIYELHNDYEECNLN